MSAMADDRNVMAGCPCLPASSEACLVPASGEADALLPLVKGDKGDKGDPFRYEDFTPEQIAELRKPATEAAERITPLPFRFSKQDMDLSPGAVYFRREEGRFVLPDGSDAPAPYNEEYPDGSVRASRERRFVCGGREYRFSGSQLVDTAVERDPDRRLARRCPTFDAHPGVAYIDRGAIGVPRHILTPGAFSVSTEGMWLRLDGGGLVPLSSLRPVASGPVEDLRFVGDCLTGRVGEDAPYDCLYVGLALDSDSADERTPAERRWDRVGNRSYIGIRYDDRGRKIFYRFDGHFPKNEITPPTDAEARSLISVVRVCYRSMSLELPRGGGGIMAQAWLGRRHYESRKKKWRWFDLRIRRTTPRLKALVRLRRVTAAGMSDWVYFHVYVNKHDGFSIIPSREQRVGQRKKPS